MATTNSDDRREYRKKRRVRNQALSYMFLVLFLVLIAGGTIFGANSYFHFWGEEKEADKPVPVIEEAPVVIEEPDVIEPVEEIDPEEQMLNEMVDSYIEQMTLQEKVAGLFIVTPEQLTGVNKVTAAGSTTQKALETYPVGGLIYFAKNITGYDKFKEMLANTTGYIKYPVFLCVDEEGGSVARIANTLSSVTKVDSMNTIGATGDTGNATSAYTTISSYLTDLGINVDFAPVSDIQTEYNTLFAERSFGSEPQSVADFVEASVLALQLNGVSACLKHFPGHGVTDADSEVGMAVTERTLDEMRESEFLPFIAGIEAGADFVMVGHISTPNVTGDNKPASLSYDIITTILREELGFKGIVITDAMNMPSITEYYLPGEAAVAALQAGADMILMPENFKDAYDAILEAITNGTLSEDRINESLKRIYRIKCADMVVTSYEDIDGNTLDNATEDTTDTVTVE